MTTFRDAARRVGQEYVGMPRQRVPGHGSTPPPPLIGPTGSPRVDAVADVVKRAVEPFRSAPNPKEGTLGAINHYVGGALGLLGLPFEMMDTGFAMLTAPLAALMPAFPAATLMAPHLGPPHTHTHPPSLIPPAPPIPLPSIGMVLLPGCVSVLHGGLPAARAGDLGMSFTCGTLAPPLDVYTGSSNTFIGGSRAARMFDITRHCNPASAASGFGKVM
ncbi:MAG: PAAR domain-containing protein, partial [Myxococcales bacterium]|nr:PAAR domain-containing protein [Myxococcales bacterium]